MKFCPRYSLLTLLVLTALVAGGVKLWYGPHHVVELVTTQFEEKCDEYTYTRDWKGERTLHGPRIQRDKHNNGAISSIRIRYYMNGIAVRDRLIWVSQRKYNVSPLIGFLEPLSEHDEAHFQAAIDLECKELDKLGLFQERKNIKIEHVD